jgi:hypothetical protein
LSTIEIGEYERHDILEQVHRVLADLGEPEPPINLNEVRELLKLDLHYYNATNTTALNEIAHKIRVGGKQLLARPTLLLDVIRKASLSALWVPDRKRILIDDSIPPPKQRWTEGHEIGHSIIPWHQQFLFGDNQFTLDPSCHAQVEAEANYAGSQLLFLQGRFASEVGDVELTWDAIKRFSKRYGNTMTTTLWRMVEDRKPEHPVVGLISRHPKHRHIGSEGTGAPVRHFIYSKAFEKQFSRTSSTMIYDLLKSYVTWQTKGPVGEGEVLLMDDNGQKRTFHFSSFCNSHDVLTFGVLTK